MKSLSFFIHTGAAAPDVMLGFCGASLSYQVDSKFKCKSTVEIKPHLWNSPFIWAHDRFLQVTVMIYMIFSFIVA